jgi:DNA-binding CsgD family transcriptional regulator
MSRHDQTDADRDSTDDEWLQHQFQIAIAEAIGNRDWPVVAALIDTHWADFVATRPQLLLDAILALPTEAYRERPRLEAGANYLEHLVAGRDPHRYHDHTRSPENPTLLDRLVLLTSRTAGSRTAGRLPAARRYALDAKRLLDAATDEERSEVRNSLPDLLLQWGRSLEVADSGEEIQLYEEAYELAQLLGNPVIKRRAAASLAWLTAWQGHLRKAEEWVRRAEHGGPPNPRYDAALQLATALIHADRFEFDDARVAFASTARLPVGEYWAAALFVRSRLVDTPGDEMALEDDLQLEEQRQPRGLLTEGTNASYLALTRLRLASAKGMVPPGQAGSLTVRSFGDSLRAIAAGEFHVALEAAMNITGAKGHPRARAAGFLLVAATRARLGRRASSTTALTQARAIIDREKLFSTYSILPADEMLQLAAAAGVVFDPWVSAVLHRFRGDTGVAEGTLSRRGKEVLQLLTTDMSTTEIAQALFISPNTLKSTTRRLYRKLGVSSRAEAADRADGDPPPPRFTPSG